MKSLDIIKLSKIPGWLNLLPEAYQDEACLIHEELMSFLKNVEIERYAEVRKVKQALREWRESDEIKEFAKEARLRYLKHQEKATLKMFRDNKARYIELMRIDPENMEIFYLKEEAEQLVKQLNSYQKEREARQHNRKDEITPEMVDRAREYPIEQIVPKERNGRAKCVFHLGEDGNMDIRKNFAFCYVCNKSSDAIGVYMAKNLCSFREAVLAMQ